MNNNTYCVKIFKGLYVEKTPDGLAKVASCCINDAGEPSNQIDFVNDKKLKRQREQISAGIKIPECSRCWELESLGQNSSRIEHNKNTRSDSQLNEVVELVTVDYNLPPICNAKCIMCSPVFSSALAAEYKKFGIPIERPFKDVSQSDIHKSLNFSNTQKIYFNGGEPLLSDELLEILYQIEQQQGSLSDVDISLHTNGSIIPNDELRKLFKKSRSVSMMLSIDAIEQSFEYIRYPLKWEEVQSNIMYLIKNAESFNIRGLAISSAIGIYNALELLDLVEWADNLMSNYPVVSSHRIQPTVGNLSFNSFDSNVKDLLLTELADNTHPVVNTVKEWIQATPVTGNNQWQEYLSFTDRRRDLDWQSVLKIGKILKK